MSFGVVPLLKDIGAWFAEAEQLHDKTRGLANRLAGGNAGRAEVAELFTLLQSPDNQAIWQEFSAAFLLGNGKKIRMGHEGTKEFPGLLRADLTEGHRRLASLLANRAAWALSLNFDGLTVRALIELNGTSGGIALHSAEDVRRYFSALDPRTRTPAVIKVRGDVFYARCNNPLCPSAATEQALDRLKSAHNEADLLCPSCREGQLLLQFLFPGFRSKEEAAYPVLWEARGFLGNRISAIIIVGLSGRWDRYLLEFLLGWARERELPVLDVKPDGRDAKVIQSFCETYFIKGRPQFQLINAEAGTWLPQFCRAFGGDDGLC